MDLARESDALREWKLRRASLRPVPVTSASTAAASVSDDDYRATAPQEWIERQQRLRQVGATATCHTLSQKIYFNPLSLRSSLLMDCSDFIMTGAPPAERSVRRPASDIRRALVPPQDKISPAGRPIPDRRRHLAIPIRAPRNHPQTQPPKGTPTAPHFSRDHS